jgi:1-acyl-sn-glycerol-3-phosphate acyltransferase
MFDPMFVPPRHHEGLFRFANTFVPQLGRLFGNVHNLTVTPADLSHLEALRGCRAIITPNHPTETDPIVIFWIARLARERFNFLATRETLEGPRGKLLNHIGVYSVIRGFPDRESVRTTRKLLAELDRKVVIFPEGLVYEHNDRLLEFQSGVVQMGFWALEDMDKAGKSPFLPLLPMSIKYRCFAPPEPYIERGLAAVERKLGLRVKPNAGRYERLRRLGSQVVGRVETAEGIPIDEDADLTLRIVAVRQKTLERVARAIGAPVKTSDPTGEQLHLLTLALRKWVGVLSADDTDYDARLYRQRMVTASPLFAELLRLHSLVAVTGDYVAEEPTAERFLEVLGRLQKEVLGKIPHQAPLEARVKIAPAVPLESRLNEYRENKRETVANVTRDLRDTIHENLRAMSDFSTPLSL